MASRLSTNDQPISEIFGAAYVFHRLEAVSLLQSRSTD
jgi:hypothetical protein